MSSTLRIKRRAVGGAAGAPVSLAAAELAFNEQDQTLYYGSGNSAGLATSIYAIGGPGAFALKGASGGPVLLNTLTASNSSSLSDLVSFTSTYQVYELQFINCIPAAASTAEIQVHSAGSFQTTGYLSSWVCSSATANTAGVATTTVYVPLSAVSAVSATVGGGVSGTVRVFNPSGTAAPKAWRASTYYCASASLGVVFDGAGCWNSTGAIDGFQFLFSAGNITSGLIKIYGLP